VELSVNRIICIIPARKGSKRIKNKNIKNFYGKPIISQVIQKLKKFKFFDKIYVSTDCNKIAKIAIKHKLKIIKRNKKLADDYTDTRTVIVDAINKLESKNLEFDIVCCVYPTSVFIKLKYLISAVKKLKKKKLDFVYTAKKYEHTIFRSLYFNSNKLVCPIFNKKNNVQKRTQDFKKVFYDAGQFYLGHKYSWKSKKNIIYGNVDFVEISRLDSSDIDNIEDWKIAKTLWKMVNK
jgi:pseudaminic acid cytidylyltransferase